MRDRGWQIKRHYLGKRNLRHCILCVIINMTRMHSSRMRTVRNSGRLSGGGCLHGGCLLLGGLLCGGCVCLLLGGVCSRGVSAPGGCSLLLGEGGVSAPGGGGCVSASGGMSALDGGGCLLWGGVSHHALRQTHTPTVDRHTPVKT